MTYGPEDDLVLAELVNRVLDRGAVVAGEVVITVAGIDLVQLGLALYVTSSETARQKGMPSRVLGRPAGPRPRPAPPDARGDDPPE